VYRPHLQGEAVPGLLDPEDEGTTVFRSAGNDSVASENESSRETVMLKPSTNENEDLFAGYSLNLFKNIFWGGGGVKAADAYGLPRSRSGRYRKYHLHTVAIPGPSSP
jgi:hypothetical protein